MKQDQDKYEGKGRWQELVSTGSVGVELVASVLIGAFIGYRLDLYFHTKPWLMVVGLFLGALAGFYNLYKVTLRSEQKR